MIHLKMIRRYVQFCTNLDNSTTLPILDYVLLFVPNTPSPCDKRSLNGVCVGNGKTCSGIGFSEKFYRSHKSHKVPIVYSVTVSRIKLMVADPMMVMYYIHQQLFHQMHSVTWYIFKSVEFHPSLSLFMENSGRLPCGNRQAQFRVRPHIDSSLMLFVSITHLREIVFSQTYRYETSR